MPFSPVSLWLLWLASLYTVPEISPPVTVRLTGPAPVPAVGVSVVETPLTLLGLTPATVLVMVTMTVQPPEGRLGTVMFNALLPVAPTTSAGLFVTPAQLPPIVVELMLILVSVSVKVAFVSAPAFVFPSVKTIVLVPPAAIVGVPKALLMVGLAYTVKFTGPAPVPAAGVCVVVTPLTLLGLTPILVLVAEGDVLKEDDVVAVIE